MHAAPPTMNADEKEIYQFLRQFKDVFVSVVEVSRRVGNRKMFNLDRIWAKPLLLRMETEGVLESNEYGEFRLRDRSWETNFIEAMRQALPTVPLGETTIIHLEDVLDENDTISNTNPPWPKASEL